MHLVEQTTWKVLSQLITHLDFDRNGVCIDAGVGDFDWYFEWFRNYGYRTIAIEPVPSEQVRALCGSSTQLIEAALTNGIDKENPRVYSKGDLKSIVPKQWGIDFESGYWKVPFCVLDEIIIEPVTCLKLDIEGAEWLALQRLPHCQHKPQVIAFEFGGLFPKHTGQGGWTKTALGNTYQCLNLLKKQGYVSFVLIGENSGGLIVKPFTDHRHLFSQDLIWGNIVTTWAKVETDDWYTMAASELRFNP